MADRFTVEHHRKPVYGNLGKEVTQSRTETILKEFGVIIANFQDDVVADRAAFLLNTHGMK